MTRPAKRRPPRNYSTPFLGLHYSDSDAVADHQRLLVYRRDHQRKDYEDINPWPSTLSALAGSKSVLSCPGGGGGIINPRVGWLSRGAHRGRRQVCQLISSGGYTTSQLFLFGKDIITLSLVADGHQPRRRPLDSEIAGGRAFDVSLSGHFIARDKWTSFCRSLMVIPVIPKSLDLNCPRSGGGWIIGNGGGNPLPVLREISRIIWIIQRNVEEKKKKFLSLPIEVLLVTRRSPWHLSIKIEDE